MAFVPKESNVPLGITAMMKKKVVPRIVPMTQEEIVHVPIIQPERITVQHDEMNVEVPVPMTQEEIVHVPIIQPVPIPMTQEQKKRKRNWDAIEERIHETRKRLNKTNKNNMNNNKNYENNNNNDNKNN